VPDEIVVKLYGITEFHILLDLNIFMPASLADILIIPYRILMQKEYLNLERNPVQFWQDLVSSS
jgi:hypothetical protein